MNLETRIRMARRQAGLSQHALAEKIGVSRSSVSNWEGRSGIAPTLTGLGKIAAATGVSVGWLAAGIAPAGSGVQWASNDDISSLAAVDPDEVRLLLSFRSLSGRARVQILRFVDATSKKESKPATQCVAAVPVAR